MRGPQTIGADTEVLVAGAGPTGLLAAAELARRGVAVRVVDKAPSRSPLSRALVIHARTLELMDLIGIADRFTRHGYPAPGLNIGLTTGNSASIELRQLDTRFPYMLVLPQEQTEEILEAHLGQQGVAVEREVELTGIEQRDDGGVASNLRLPGGRKARVRAGYLLGCDGAHSTVRQAAGLAFEGGRQDYVTFLGDVKLDSQFERTRITNFAAERGFVSVLPFLGEYVRIFAVDFAKQQGPPTDELTLAELQDTVDAMAPGRLTLTEPRWLARFRSPSRQVPALRAGRVFLAGDAAHAHSPAGGQGMNSGLQDAGNLAWKLAMVLRGQAPERLLDSYDAERHPVDTRIQRATDLMFRSFVVHNPTLKAARDLAARTVVPLPPVRQRLAEALSGIGISYRFTAQSRGDGAGWRPRAAPQAGDRVPDLELWAARQPNLRLYELLREPAYTLWIYARARRLAADRDRLAALLRWLHEACAEAVRPHLVLDEGVPEVAAQVQAAVLVDFRGQFHGKLGADHGDVLLLRPDGYLAFHRHGLDLDALVAALTPWVGDRSAAHPALIA